MRCSLLLSLVVALFAVEHARAQPLGSEELALRAGAERVVRVEATGAGSRTTAGSGVVVARGPGGRTVDVVTTFHTLRGAERLTLSRVVEGPRGPVVRTLHAPDAVLEAAVAPEYDLALVRVPLRADAPPLADPWPLAATSPQSPPQEVAAFALGYPSYAGGKQLTAVGVRAHGRQPAKRVLLRSLQRLPSWRSFHERRLPRELDFSFLIGPPTAPGMSGGPVVSREGCLLGLVWGRLVDRAGIYVPIDALAKLRKRALAPFPVTPDPLSEAWLALEGLQAQFGADCPADLLDWDDHDRWLEAFNMPAAMRERFQEVSLALSGVRAEDAWRLELDARSLIGEAHALEVWVNGHQSALTPERPVLELGRTKAGAGHLRPGDNLLILKLQGSDPLAEGGDLSRLLRSKGFDVRLKWRGAGASAPRDMFRLRRTLPAAVRGFAVYLSLRLPGSPESAPPTGRLGVSLDRFEKALGRLSLALPLRSGDGVSRAFRGKVTLQRPSPAAIARLRSASPVPLGDEPLAIADDPAGALVWRVSLMGVVEVEEAMFRGFGARIVPEFPSGKLAFSAQIRVQVINGKQGPFVALRAQHLVTDQVFLQSLLKSEQGFSVKVDLTRLVHEGLLQWFNGQILHAPEPRALELGDVAVPLELARGGKRLPALQGLQVLRLERERGDGGDRLQVYLRDQAAGPQAKLPSLVVPSDVALDLHLIRTPGAAGLFKDLVPLGGGELSSLWVGLRWKDPAQRAALELPTLTELSRGQLEDVLRKLLPARVDVDVVGR